MSSEDENFALKLLLLPVGAAAKKYIESEEPTVIAADGGMGHGQAPRMGC